MARKRNFSSICTWRQLVMRFMGKGKKRKRTKKIVERRNWAEINTDILSLIFEKLGAAQVLMSAEMVCWSWRKVALEPGLQVWRCINMLHVPYTIFGNGNTDIVQAAIDRSGGRIEKLYTMHASDKFLTYITGRTGKLRCLGLAMSTVSREVMRNFVAQCGLLEKLYICLCGIDSETYGDIGRACPKLTCLHLGWNAEDTEDEYGFQLCDDDMALEIANNMPQLRELQISGALDLTEEGIHAILDRCLHLEYLDIQTCDNVQVDSVLQARLKKIKIVKLRIQES